MAFWDFLFGSNIPEQQVPVERYKPWQEAMMQQLGQQGSTGLQGILNAPLDSRAMEEEAMRQYQQQIVPSLMSSLTAAPSAGLQRTSAFGQQLGASGADLATRLAALRSQVAMQQQGLRANIYGNMLGQGTQPMFDTMVKPAQTSPGLVGTFANAFMPGVGSYLASSLFNRQSTPTFGGGTLGNLNSSPESQWLNAFKPGNFNVGSGI